MILNNYSPLAFYDSLEEQTCRRKYAYGEVYPLYVHTGKIMPFQFCVGSNGNSISSVLVVDFNTGASVNVTSSITITKKAFTGYDVFVCRGQALDAISHEGRWYLQINVSNTGVETIYSEVFTAVGDTSGYLKIEWSDKQDLVMDGSSIVYQISGQVMYHHEVYLDTQLGMPDYDFEEEGETRDGLFFPEKMISEKTYKFSFLAPEYLLDAMRFIRMSDTVNVTDWTGNSYTCDTFLMTPKWQAPGFLAGVDAEFQTMAVAKKIGRSY